jgi:ferredoxin
VTWRLAIDVDRCCGAGMCALSAPALFDQRDSDGQSVLLQEFVPPGELRDAEVAVVNCPCRAIRLFEQDGKD